MSKIERDGNYSSRHIVVCEGFSDVAFLDALLSNRGITEFDIGCPNQTNHGADGVSGIPSYLEALRAHRNGKNIETLVVMVDADTNHEKAFADVCKALKSADADFSPPGEPWKATDDNPRTGVIVIPKPLTNGTMEDLLTDAAFTADPKLKGCVDDFVKCVGKSTAWSSNKIAKMKASCAIAVSCSDDPSVSLAWLWKKKNEDIPFPLQSPVFDPIANFLRQVLNKKSGGTIEAAG